MTCGIHKDDIGTTIIVTVCDCNSAAIDISTADTKQIIFKKPSGANLTKDADFVTDGNDGKIQYIIQEGDIDEVGTWKIQGIVTIGAYTWHSNFESFKVHRNL